MLSPEHQWAVEFFGGPIDGHIEVLPIPPEDMVDVLGVVAMERDFFGPQPSQPFEGQRVAIYELQQDGSRCGYRYLGTVPGKISLSAVPVVQLSE